MDDWYNHYHMNDAAQDAKGAGRQRFYSNEPRTLANVCVNLLSTNPPKLRIALGNEQREERDLISKVERFFYGALNDIDEQRRNRLEQPLQSTMAFNAVVSGWIAGRFIMTNAHEPSPVDHQFYDPYTVFPELGSKGMRSVIQTSKMTLGEISDEWDMPIDSEDPTQEVTVYDGWDRNINAVVCEWGKRGGVKQEWAKKPTKHGLNRIPWMVMPVNGTPLRRDIKRPTASAYDATNTGYTRSVDTSANIKKTNHWVASMGQSIFAANERHYPQFNEFVALVMQVVSNEAYGTLTFKSRDGKAVDIETGNNVVNFLRLEEELEKLQGGVAPPDTSRILTLMGSQVQRGGIPFSVYGELPFEISGYLNNQLVNAAMLVLRPFMAGMIAYYSWLFAELQQQFMAGKFTGIGFHGIDSKNTLFEFTYDSEQQTKRYFGEIKLQPALPTDLAQKVEMARRLRDSRWPMASIQTIFDKILEWEDPDGEIDKIFDDMANQEPLVVLERMAQALDQRGLPEVAQVMRERGFKTKFMEELQMKGAVAAMGGMGGPGGPGLSTSTISPEQRGLPTEGAPPSPSVSPQDARARLARMGMVGPNG